MEALEQVGIFDPLMMQVLNRQHEQLRAGVNYHLLGAMRRIEERTASDLRSRLKKKSRAPKQATRRKAGLSLTKVKPAGFTPAGQIKKRSSVRR